MGSVLRHFWIAFVVMTVVQGQAWWIGAQERVRANPELGPGYRRLYRGYLFWMNVPWLAMGAGALSGRVEIFDFLQPRAGNPFVLAWWGLMAALFALGTFWMFVGGGAETLERHPGLPMVPQWPASKLKVFWLGVVAWNVGIGSLMFFASPALHSAKPDSASPLHVVLPVLFPVLLVGMWLLISWLLAAMSGWQLLAGHYRLQEPFSGSRSHFCSAAIGPVNYGSCLTFGTGPQGLMLATQLPFRFAHPALLIPWGDITAQETRSWFIAAVELRFARATTTSVRLRANLARELLEASQGRVPVRTRAPK